MYIIPAASSPNQKRLGGWLYRRVQLSIVPSICQKCDILVTNVTLLVPFYAKRRELVLEKLAGPVKPESPMEEPGSISNERTFWRKQWGEGVFVTSHLQSCHPPWIVLRRLAYFMSRATGQQQRQHTLQFLIQLIKWHNTAFNVLSLVEVLLRLLVAFLELYHNSDHLVKLVNWSLPCPSDTRSATHLHVGVGQPRISDDSGTAVNDLHSCWHWSYPAGNSARQKHHKPCPRSPSPP